MPYKFKSAVAGADSFVNKYIEYASQLTDAAHDYHEAMAFFLLSIAAQGMKLDLPNMPNGLRPNLYLIIYGVSSHSRKSTAMDIAKDICQRAIPGVQLPANFTPGGLEEELAERPMAPSALFADEFSRVLDQMHHQSYMSGLRGFLLTMYSTETWEYRKTSKGKSKTRDEVVIKGSHLCIAGNVTPVITKHLEPRDIEDGFLARFGIINPASKPPRKKIGELTRNERARNSLVMQLSGLRQFCKKHAPSPEDPEARPFPISISEPALDALDEFQEKLEKRNEIDTSMIMMERIGIMSFKLAMLIALGRQDLATMKGVNIGVADVHSAVAIADKWCDWGVNFAGSLYESEIEKHIRRASGWLNEYDGQIPRWQVAKKMRLSKRQLDEVQMTMLDRGLITLEERKVGDAGKPKLFWIGKGGDDE